MECKYYLTQRPHSLGTFPDSKNNKAMGLHGYDNKEYVEDIGCDAWGYVTYKEPLTDKEISDYELVEGVKDEG